MKKLLKRLVSVNLPVIMRLHLWHSLLNSLFAKMCYFTKSENAGSYYEQKPLVNMQNCRRYTTVFFLIILITCISSVIVIGCGNKNNKSKYTNSDIEFLDKMAAYMKSNIKYMEEIEDEAKRWPKTNIMNLNKNIMEVNNIIERAYKIEKPDNKVLLNAYIVWIKSLNDIKICFELLNISIKYQDADILKRAIKYLEEYRKGNNEYVRILKEDLN